MYVILGVNALNDTTQFGMSQDPVLLHSISCSGAEEKLIDCKLDSNTEGDSHISDAGASCLLRGDRGYTCIFGAEYFHVHYGYFNVLHSYNHTSSSYIC